MIKNNILKKYVELTKPGIIFGNAVTACAGFMLASRGHVNFGLFFAALAGLCLIVASGCVWNNYIDRDMDEKMNRTRNRALVKKEVDVKSALYFGMLLGFLGITVLSLFTNLLATACAACGFFTYVILYSFSKYKTSLATLIGSISGAIPPVVGYTAVSNSLDLGALLLFLIVVFWQMPHFYAIAMYRLEDYAAASIPVLPVCKGVFTAKVHSLLYTIGFAFFCIMLFVCGYTGYTYLLVALVLSAAWIWLSIKGFTCESDIVWARKMFFMSLFIIMALSITISLDFVQSP